MEKVIIEQKILTSSGTILSAIIGVLGITCMIFLGVEFYIGSDRSPSGMEEMVPYAGLGAIVFTAIAVFIYMKSKVLLQLIDLSNGNFKLKIEDPREPKILQTPWEYCYGYEKVKIQSGAPKMKVLLLTFYQDNRCILQLKEELGAIHSAPRGWVESYSHFKEDLDKSKFKHIHYNGGSLSKIVDVLEAAKNGSN